MWLMRVVVVHPYTKFVVCRRCHSEEPFGRCGARCMSALMGLVTLTFDLLTLKLVCKLRQRWPTFRPNLARWAFGFSNHLLCT